MSLASPPPAVSSGPCGYCDVVIHNSGPVLLVSSLSGPQVPVQPLPQVPTRLNKEQRYLHLQLRPSLAHRHAAAGVLALAGNSRPHLTTSVALSIRDGTHGAPPLLPFPGDAVTGRRATAVLGSALS